MTLFRSLIRATSTTDYFRNRETAQSLTPAERLLHVIGFTNNYLAETHSAATFATIFIGIVDLRINKLTYINCGNEPPILLRKGGAVTILQPTGPIVGIITDACFDACEIEMEQGDLLVAFTDGITDALNENEEFFGRERLLEVLVGTDLAPAKLIKDIEQHLHQFIGTSDQFDDITLLALRKM
jgi:sigma-B regulation protein RsbU (phosphoserine phosphatase)